MVVLTIISIMTLQLGLAFKPIVRSNEHHFENEYKLSQIQSISLAKKHIVETENSNVDALSFNSFGHVNQAQTITFEKHLFVIQLGMGRYEIR